MHSQLTSLPKLRTSTSQSSIASTMDSRVTSSYAPTHSRASSVASNASSPVTSAFSVRSHNRWPSSSSSLATNPDSPTLAPSKTTTLHDLVEDPSEQDDGVSLSLEPLDLNDASFCMCDNSFCEHRRAASGLSSEWSQGDDSYRLPGEPALKRQRSGDMSIHSLTSRLSRRLPSMSKRWPAHKSSISAAEVTMRSAPLSRASSLKRSSSRRDQMTRSVPEVPLIHSPIRMSFDHDDARQPRSRRASEKLPTQPRGIRGSASTANLRERLEPILTPLLPHAMDKHAQQTPVAPSYCAPMISSSNTTAIYSPRSFIQSRASSQSNANSVSGSATPASPTSTFSRREPSSPAVLSPLLSPTSLEEEDDEYTHSLGHANFHIQPAPYFPAEPCTAPVCQKLLNDWEAARKSYMCLAAALRETHGPTSQIFSLAEEKWRGIDARWRAFHAQANRAAAASGDSPQFFQPLGETAPMTLPDGLLALDVGGPHTTAAASAASHPAHYCSSRTTRCSAAAASGGGGPPAGAKFPAVAQHEIVGPMVQYQKVRRCNQAGGSDDVVESGRSSSKNSFLRIFTAPASLLFGGSR